MKALEEQTKPTGSIIGKKTQDIGKFDEKVDGDKVASNEVKVTDPVLGSLEAYAPILQKNVADQIDYAMKLYEAEHGHLPKDYDEFMEKIIKANNIQLPVLPGKRRWMYDEKNRKLIAVETQPEK
ncbi:MAG: hypothetical protein ACRDD1_07025 [Planctomycetia bacterium]